MASRLLLSAVMLGVLIVGGAVAAKEISSSPDGRLADLLRLVESDPVLAGVNKDEALVAELRAAVLAPWERAWAARDGATSPQLAPLSLLNWSGAKRKLTRERDGIREYTWALRTTGKSGSEAQRYLSGFEKVDYFHLEPLKIEPGEDRAVLEVRYDMRASIKGGGRRHDRGELRLNLAREGGVWRLKAVSPVVGLVSLEAERVLFEDATVAWGLDKAPVLDRKEAIRRGGYAIAAADYDGDKRPDLLVGGRGPVQLYRNAGGRFEDVTEAAGLAGETMVKSAAFADFDNDGLRDLLLLRFVDGDDKDGDLVAYRNAGHGKFVRAGERITRTRKYDRTMPLTIADFNVDGNLDLYLGFPGNKDFTYMKGGTQDLASQGVWLNDGRWGFIEAPKQSGVWDSGGIYPHSALASDLNQDGLPDLVVVNDRAGLSPVYLNRGKGNFEEVSKKIGIVNESWAMTAAAGDYDEDGFPDLVLTNIEFQAAHRILKSRAGRSSGPKEDAGLQSLTANMAGNRLFRNKGDGTFEETTDKAGIRWAGEATAGADWLDLYNSGRQDLYIMNGLWSGGAHDIASLYVRMQVNRNAPYAAAVIDNIMNSPLALNEPGMESPFMGMLRNVMRAPGILSGPQEALPALSMAGGQRNNLFRNNGDGTFTEIGYLVGADRVEDGYVSALADVDGDGAQDLILRNGDPAPGRNFPAVLFLRNTVADKNHNSLMVFAEGSRSNRDGIGALVTAFVGKRKLVREIRGPVGAAQSEPVAFFGIGEAKRVDRLEVRWPSGLKEEFLGVSAGRVVLREGNGYISLAAK